MKLYLCFIVILNCVFTCTTIDTMVELKRNVLKFGYGINYKYEEILSHSFDRFCVVTKFELPKVQDLKLTTISYDSNCQYLDDAMNLKDHAAELIRDIKNYCVKIAPYIDYYKKQIDYYNQTTCKIIM